MKNTFCMFIYLYKHFQQDHGVYKCLFQFFSSSFALLANVEVFILVPSLTYFLPFSQTYSSRKLKTSVNIVARTQKYCMNPPYTQSLWFREKQLGGPYEVHVSAVKGSSFGYFYCIFAYIFKVFQILT